MTGFLVKILIASMLTVPFGASAAASADVPSPDITGRVQDRYADLLGRQGASASTNDGQATLANRATVRLVRMFVPACNGNLPTINSIDALCPSAKLQCLSTPDPNDILFWIFVAPAGPPSPSPEDFRYSNQAVCRGVNEVPEAAVPVFTARDFRRLPLPAGGVHVQPPNLRTLINVPTNVYVDARQVILNTTLLGFPVRVRATPVRYTWTFGDGGSLVTTDAGAPYPDLRTTHVYRQPGAARLTLTTSYTGEYSVAGGPWLPIDGEAQVASPLVVLTVLSAENRLVADPVP